MNTTCEIMQPFFNDVAASPFLIAPERANELAERLGAAGVIDLQLVDGRARFVAMPGEGAHIRVSASGLASLWALSYVAYRFLDVGSRAAASPEGQSAGQLVVYADPVYQKLVEFARRLYQADELWADELPRPIHVTTLGTIDGCANNLFLAATGCVLLHEIGHITLGHNRLMSESL